MKKYLKYLVVPIILFIVLRLMFITDFWVNLENKAQDTFFLLRGEKKTSDEIVIVEIADDTFATLNERWPFPRDYHARLIENLERAGAKQIIIDIEFTEKTHPDADAELAAVCAKYDNIILSGKLIKNIYEQSVREQFLAPLKQLIETGTDWGMVNISAEQDGFVRKYDIFQSRQNESKLSLGALSILKTLPNNNDYENKRNYFRIGDIIIPKLGKNRCLINYYGPARTFETIDYSDVLDDSTFTTSFEKEIEAELNQFEAVKNKFKDKIVLIGMTALEFHDTHYTPFFAQSQELTPGVEIHANFIEMVLNRDFLKEFPYLLFILIFLILCFILFPINVQIKPTFSFFLGMILSLIYIFSAYQIFAKASLFLPILEIPVLLIITYIIGLIFQYVKTARERKFIKSAFGQYIAPDLINELLKDPAKLEYGGSQKEISVLFCDIVSFTPYTESHTPKQTVEILREYLTNMVEVITNNKGTLDKFVGDEIIAIFGAPIDMEDHAFWACKAAIEMRERMIELFDIWEKEGKDPFDIGIGINTGLLTVGNLGSEQIFDYTAIGDNMNAGARIEALTRDYETKNNIIISENTLKSVENRIITSFIDEAKVKGKTQTIRIYELLGIKKEINQQENID